MRVFRLLDLKATPGVVRGIEGLRSPLVGREAELGQLQTALHALQEGQGGVVAIVGGAGQEPAGRRSTASVSRRRHLG